MSSERQMYVCLTTERLPVYPSARWPRWLPKSCCFRMLLKHNYNLLQLQLILGTICYSSLCPRNVTVQQLWMQCGMQFHSTHRITLVFSVFLIIPIHITNYRNLIAKQLCVCSCWTSEKDYVILKHTKCKQWLWWKSRRCKVRMRWEFKTFKKV